MLDFSVMTRGFPLCVLMHIEVYLVTELLTNNYRMDLKYLRITGICGLLWAPTHTNDGGCIFVRFALKRVTVLQFQRKIGIFVP